MNTTVIFTRDDMDLIVAFAGCSLDESPGKNWVERGGGLPEYICRIARAIKRTGKTTGQAIAIAVSRVKKWAAGADNVNADTRAKAAKAVAEWEKLKTKNRAKTAAKVAATATATDVLCLTTTDFNVEMVRSAFERRQREARKAYRAANPTAAYDDCPPHLYVKEQWTTYLIVSSGYGDERTLFKVPYEVDATNNVTFGEPVEVKTEYVVVSTDDMTGADITDADLQKMMDLCGPCPERATATLMSMTAPAYTPLERILRLAASNTVE